MNLRKLCMLFSFLLSFEAFAQMTIVPVTTENAPKAIGPYSQAIQAGGSIYLSGQLPIDPTSGTVFNQASIEEQTRLVLKNLEAVLVAAGTDMSRVVSTTVYMKDLEDFPRMNSVYATFFTSNFPSRATIQVARLPRDVSVEISAVAIAP